MRPSDTLRLPIEYRFRADVVALCCGLAALPLAAIVLRYSRVEQLGIAILLLLISLSLAAGFATISYLHRSNIAWQEASHPIRAGARAGLLTATLAAAMTILAARMFQSQLTAVAVFTPSLLSILPGSFFGMIATAFAVGIPVAFISPPIIVSKIEGERKLPINVLLALLCVIGFVSVVIPQGIQRVAAQFPTRSTNNRWKYERPAELTSTDASRWELLTTRPLGRVREDLPLALSPNGERFAFFDADQANSLKVVDLSQPDNSYTFGIAGQCVELAFSPSNSELLFEIYDGGRRIGVADIPKRRVIMLPTPKGGAVPQGKLSWPSEKEAIFHNSKSPFRMLDLDMLELDNTNKDAEPPPTALPSTARIGFELRRAITNAEVPTDVKQREWPMTGAVRLSIDSIEKNYRRFFNLDAQVGDRFLGSPDGSILIRIRNSVAIVSYFGLRSKPALSFTFEMPTRAETHPDRSRVTAALAADELCALVYAPLINPLNDKIIGPDRDRVKGVVRISSWKERNVSAWLAEEFEPIATNDVIADLHTWKSYAPELMLETERRWWTKIIAITDSQRDIASVPSYPAMKPLARSSTVELVPDSGTLKVQNTESRARQALPVAVVPEYTPVPQHTPIPTTNPSSFTQNTASLPSETPRSSHYLGPDDPAFQSVSAFVQAHHQKANRADLNALINDYDDQVLFFDKGQVDKAYIYKNEALSRSSFQQMTENIIYPLTIREDGVGQFAVRYQIAWEAVKKDGRRSNGISEVNLYLHGGPQGLKIISHNFDPKTGD